MISAAHHNEVACGDQSAMIGRSPAMRAVMATIERIAQSPASAVITGESGTGKELVARTIHQLSARRDAPYVAVNCAAIPESLMESELFGHERGAFTGADRRQEGCFEMANGGTLLLDEITEMKAGLQAKLLRVLEEHRLRRVGGSVELSLDVRVLATTNRNVEQTVREGRLRPDLYYRLNIFTVHLPPLRERVEDLPMLIEAFLRQFSRTGAKEITGIDEACLDLLRAHPWPGNVRQLRNVIERACIVCQGGLIRKQDLPEEFRNCGPQGNGYFMVRLGTSLTEVERELISRTIDYAGGNKTRAAQILGVSTRTIYNKLDQYAQPDSQDGTHAHSRETLN
ncbi:MAG: sigma-54-dependent Fis family transcriptional regulator [Candidatus Binataceae bacterium]|nr:sigma-54-dependent Fis family transcriptional regulator [Candidatus Binataceae bacterium]